MGSLIQNKKELFLLVSLANCNVKPKPEQTYWDPGQVLPYGTTDEATLTYLVLPSSDAKLGTVIQTFDALATLKL